MIVEHEQEEKKLEEEEHEQIGEKMIDLYTWSTSNGRKISIMLEEVDVPDARWAGSLVSFLLGSPEPAAQLGRVRSLCKAARDTLRAQPVLVHVAAPAKVFGDIHGQFRDLLLREHETLRISVLDRKDFFP